MQTVMIYSEAGGVSKTTTAVSLAVSAAREQGKKTLLIDLDPRGAATKWLGVAPNAPTLTSTAILNDPAPHELIEGTIVGTPWSENLSFIPASRDMATLEAMRVDHAELRLKAALRAVDADLVVIDCANRQGGLLTLSALTAADSVIYAATPTADGVHGVHGARESVARFKEANALRGSSVELDELGIVVSGVETTVVSRVTNAVLDDLRDTGLLLNPVVPQRTIVREVRLTNEWYGDFRKGQPVAEAYATLAREVIR